ncbi:MAG: adenosylmethionine--8-amino-7-oxononanoate transaminase [Deltaproteobacteria bacterium]|nr:adenosylmethionine--8-amino-7-oxononanoate transaminase [Deltaproteobacteria bacterium]
MNPEWLERGKAHVWRPYCQHQTAPDPLAVVAARGCRLTLADGSVVVDGIASWWTAAHGYGHPHIAARVLQQLERLPHVAFGGLAHEAGYSLATRLASLFPEPLNRVFFVESGSVAVEVALKISLRGALGGSSKTDVVAFSGAYHGDTFATMALCDPAGMHGPSRGAFPVHHFAIPGTGDPLDQHFEERFAAVAGTTAACIIEPLLQAAGGMRFHDVDVLRRVRAACTRHDVALIFDEVATGFFRTGRRFALEEAAVVPDVVVVGKALTGGTLPLAAVVASDALFAAFLSDDAGRALQHGPTYMANPLACAAAHGSLDLFEAEDYGAKVTALEHKLRAGLSPLSSRASVREVRVKGGVGVVELEPGTAPSSSSFAARGAFVRPLRFADRDLVYLMPPLVIDDDDLGVLFGALAAEIA